jgi:hypothetical protein
MATYFLDRPCTTARAVLGIAGELDYAEARTLRRRLKALTVGPDSRELVLDLRRVTFIGSESWRCIEELTRRLPPRCRVEILPSRCVLRLVCRVQQLADRRDAQQLVAC